MTLVNYSLDSDIAVFRTVFGNVLMKPELYESDRFISPSELDILPLTSAPRTVPIFLVAYCSPDIQLSENFIAARKLEDATLHGKLMSILPRQTTRYEYMHKNYMTTIKSLDPETYYSIGFEEFQVSAG